MSKKPKSRSTLRDTLDNIFKTSKSQADAIQAAAKRTGQKPTTLKIYYWRYKKTGTTHTAVVKKKGSKKTWKAPIWNKGQGKKKPKVAKKLRGKARRAKLEHERQEAIAPKPPSPGPVSEPVAS